MSERSLDCERLFFEVIERTIRFISHVDSSCAQAARPNRRKTAQETIARTLTTRLEGILNSLISTYKTEDMSENEFVSLLHQGLVSLAELHTGPLSAVPRPHEPIELVSYIRQVYKTYPDHEARANSAPHVFASEVLGDQAHSRFDHHDDSNFEMAAQLTIATKTPSNFVELAESFLSDVSNPPCEESDNTSESKLNYDNSIGFVSLPRIDLGNPLRWSSLAHETGHFEQESIKQNVWDSFSKLLNGQIKDSAEACMEKYLNKSNADSIAELQKWLVECLCDIHAVRAVGAPVLFSQMHAFLFSSPCYLTESESGKGYPPAWFRLRLMRDLISTRHKEDNPSNSFINKMIADEWNILEKLFPSAKDVDIKHDGNLKNLFNYFMFFLTHYFSQDTWFKQSQINPTDLNELIEDLSNGLPIPTHRKFIANKQMSASHAEIFLAGWSYRNTKYKQSLIEIVKKSDFNLISDLPQLLAIVNRADASLKMSIQVSEWFTILEKPNNKDNVSEELKKSNSAITSGLLVDKEIVDLLLDNSLRIIPLIDSIEEIVGTVVDLRLGHNFEIFFTNISGSVDALNNNPRQIIDSMEVDYDSLEGLEIAPGQFILGHTLEYLKLPPNVAAEINGRSSFARLGIEVHMTAPLIEAGFEGCLTLEIANSGHSSIKLYPGMRIAQLRFFRCSSRPKMPYSDRSEVKYRGQLRHNKTAQFNDWEIEAFNKEKERRKG